VDPLAELLGGTLDDFVRARDAKAKELAAAGDAEKAKEVKALRRPTVSAWAVNRLAHEGGDELDALFEAADRVRSEKGDALREAMRERTAAHGRALAKAKAILEAAGHAAQPETLRRIGGTLHAAEIGARARARVEAGMVTEDLDASSMEDDDAPATKPARVRPATAKTTTSSSTKSAPETVETRAQKEAREHARKEKQRREAEAKRLEQERDVARRSLEASERRVSQAQSSLEAAQRAHDVAEKETRDARARHEQAERAWRAAVAAAAKDD
jgi:hypothetical protein